MTDRPRDRGWRRILRYLGAGLADLGAAMWGTPIPRLAEEGQREASSGPVAVEPRREPDRDVPLRPPLTAEERAEWLDLTRRLGSFEKG